MPAPKQVKLSQKHTQIAFGTKNDHWPIDHMRQTISNYKLKSFLLFNY